MDAAMTDQPKEPTMSLHEWCEREEAAEVARAEIGMRLARVSAELRAAELRRDADAIARLAAERTELDRRLRSI
jgi:hypothetical protein